MIRHFLLIVVLLLPASVSTQGIPRSPTEVLTLEQAVALAMENNRTVRNAELEVSKAEDRQRRLDRPPRSTTCLAERGAPPTTGLWFDHTDSAETALEASTKSDQLRRRGTTFRSNR